MLAFHIDKYDYLLDRDQRERLQEALYNSVVPDMAAKLGKVRECELEQAILKLWTGDEQMRALVGRSADAFDSIDFAMVFAGPVVDPVVSPKDRMGWFRTLWYLSVIEQAP
jgi:hypothetical protein